jgi:hypothetical protein
MESNGIDEGVVCGGTPINRSAVPFHSNCSQKHSIRLRESDSLGGKRFGELRSPTPACRQLVLRLSHRTSRREPRRRRLSNVTCQRKSRQHSSNAREQYEPVKQRSKQSRRDGKDEEKQAVRVEA